MDYRNRHKACPTYLSFYSSEKWEQNIGWWAIKNTAYIKKIDKKEEEKIEKKNNNNENKNKNKKWN